MRCYCRDGYWGLDAHWVCHGKGYTTWWERRLWLRGRVRRLIVLLERLG